MRTRPRIPTGLPKTLAIVGGQAPKAIKKVEAFDFKNECWDKVSQDFMASIWFLAAWNDSSTVSRRGDCVQWSDLGYRGLQWKFESSDSWHLRSSKVRMVARASNGGAKVYSRSRWFQNLNESFENSKKYSSILTKSIQPYSMVDYTQSVVLTAPLVWIRLKFTR